MNKDKIDCSGLELISMFAIPPYNRGFCGSGKVSIETFESFVQSKDVEVGEIIMKEIRAHFRTLWPYLQTLSEVLDVQPFSIKAAEFYIFGKGDLDLINHNEFLSLLVKNLKDQGYRDLELANLTKQAPTPILPSHAYHLILTNRLTLGVGGELWHINNCMTRTGTVVGSFNNEKMVEIKTVRFEWENEKLVLKPFLIWAKADPKLLGKELIIGDKVATHWDWVIKILNDEDYIIVNERAQDAANAFNNKKG